MPMAVVDFHSHILPRIDDGSRSTEMTAEMLSNAAVQGIDIMVATPHFYADSTTIDRFLRHRERAYLATQPIAEAKKIQVICGAEVAFFPGMSRADDIEQLCIGDTSLMMVEMPFRAWTDRDLREMELMLNRGIQPVIAHLERFYRNALALPCLEPQFQLQLLTPLLQDLAQGPAPGFSPEHSALLAQKRLPSLRLLRQS